MYKTRTPFQVVVSATRAVFFREALARISARDTAWVWLFVEPFLHIVFTTALLIFVRHKLVGGIDTVIWVVAGMMSFFLFRRTALQSMNAIGSNRSLFVYRQVRPVITVLVKGFLEGLIAVLVSAIFIFALYLINKLNIPNDPLLMLGAIFGLWLLAIGFGLLFSVPVELIKDFDQILKFVMTPLYLVSGVLFPIAMVKYEFRYFVLFNPIVHGVESVRLGYSAYYHTVPGINLIYTYFVAFAMIFFGLLLQKVYMHRLIAR